jgi:hypothetical protein
MHQSPGKPLVGADSSVPPSTSSTSASRRRFLFSLSAGTAGAAAVVAAPVVAHVAPVGAVVSQPAADSAGYQESEHVRTYYRTARL